MTQNRLSRVRARREALGLSQLELAERTAVSRQSVSSIESGRHVPSVDVAMRLAAALRTTVDELFADDDAAPILQTHGFARTIGTRVSLARVDERWISLALSSDSFGAPADGVVRGVTDDRVLVEPLRRDYETRRDVIVAGCAMALGLVAESVNERHRNARIVWHHANNTDAFGAQLLRFAHVAGYHSDDGATETKTLVSHARALGRTVAVVKIARWEVGFLFRPGDERRFKRLPKDAFARGIRLVQRENGSGAQRHLEALAREIGVSDKDINWGQQVCSHRDVARVVEMGACDIGFATRDAAIASGLTFVAVGEENYSVVAPQALFVDEGISRFVDAFSTRQVRRELECLGYDLTGTGTTTTILSATTQGV